ncbi:MAG: protein phosphatase 2C domain-containing protein [Saprospiraceae bacterium]
MPYFDSTQGPSQIVVGNNETILFAIADGMGGTNAGEVAATIAIDTVKDIAERSEIKNSRPVDTRKALESIIYKAHENIKKAISDENRGMGTTLILVLIRDNSLYVTWCGDSRAYKYSPRIMERKNKYDLPNLKILSHDHSVVWQMVRKGKLDPNAAREHELSNVITQSLGDPKSDPKPDSALYSIEPGDKILICSDGLNSMIPDEFIQELLSHEESVESLSNSLIEAANTAGGYDNISLILVQVDAVPETSLSLAKPLKGRPEAITAKSDIPASKIGKSNILRGLILKKIVLIFILVASIILLIYFMFNNNRRTSGKIEDQQQNQNINTYQADTPITKPLTDTLRAKRIEEVGNKRDMIQNEK